MKKIAVTLVAVMALFGTAACGEGEKEAVKPVETVETTEAPVVAYDEAEVMAHIGQTDCEIAVIMTTPTMVDMYAEAGDTVATNPDGTVGVKITGSNAGTCQAELTETLSTFPDGEPVEAAPVETEEATGDLELEVSVQQYTNAFLTGDGQTAHSLFSERCKGLVDRNWFIGYVMAAEAQYGSATPVDTYKADINGDKATVTYGFKANPELNQTDEPWVLENGAWLLDECPV